MSTGTPIEGAVALVTGANRGLGRALVEELLDRGATKVYAASRSPQAMSDDPRVAPLQLDVTDDASVNSATEAAHDVSIVVNNAGIHLATPLLEAPLDVIQRELDTNVYGPLRVARAFAPVLAEHAPSALVNVLSALSWVSFGTGYDLSKSAAWSATNGLRTALREQGTTVTALHVGYMDTDMAAHVDAPKADPHAVAGLTVDAIIAGEYEILADDTSRQVKSLLSGDLTQIYGQLAAA
jgi:NAD(P)-dependent dehydrogenase (short-subunit alcohol dehydrogenase family)